MKCIIVEDEPLALTRVSEYVGRVPYLELAATFDNGIDALVYLQEHEVDLVFLDINLGSFSGIHMLETAKLRCKVIITTAYDTYAVKGYELNVTDYLLKPFTFERFFAAVNRARSTGIQKAAAPVVKNYFFVKTEHRLEKINLSDVWYIEGMRDYRRIHCTGKKIMTLQTFNELETTIPEDVICRVHKSYMVALDKINFVEPEGVLIGEQFIPVSSTYKKRFLALIQAR